ncbi:MAG: TolC family protein [Vicinamibacteria bacterium]|nr:TolC family protein [Vicinamibacteria bacterium]
MRLRLVTGRGPGRIRFGGSVSSSILVLAASVSFAQPAPIPGLPLSEAVRLTLERQPGIKLAEEQLSFVNGSLQTALGAFDVQFGSRLGGAWDRVPLASDASRPGLAESRITSFSYVSEASKLFKNGLLITPSISLASGDSNLATFTESRSVIAFTLRQPLLRGRGEGGVAAASTAVGLDRDATAFDLRHVVSLSVLDTVYAYWSYLAAVERMRIVRESEDRFAELQEHSEKLLEAREVAAVDLKQLSANVARRRISRLQAEQTVFDARVRLGLSVGLDAASLISMGSPQDPFPSPQSESSSTDVSALIQTALAERADLRAARLRQDSVRVAVGAAKNATRASLDLVVGTSYSGESERGGVRGFLGPLGDNLRGPSASAALVFEWPTSNRAALGRLAENQSSLRQSGIALADLERVIGARVALAVNNVEKSAARLSTARESCDLYREALAAERQRLQIGISSVLDVINTEDRLNESLLEAVSAELDYAQSVAALRFETGTLVQQTANGDEIDFASLTTPPRH